MSDTDNQDNVSMTTYSEKPNIPLQTKFRFNNTENRDLSNTNKLNVHNMDYNEYIKSEHKKIPRTISLDFGINNNSDEENPMILSKIPIKKPYRSKMYNKHSRTYSENKILKESNFKFNIPK